MTAPAEDPRGGERRITGRITRRDDRRPLADTEDDIAAMTAAGRGDTDSGGEHVGSCRIFYAERRCTCVGPAARPAGDRAQPTEGLRELRADMIAMLPGVYPWGDVVDRLLAGPLDRLLAEAGKYRALREGLDRLVATAPAMWHGDYPVSAVAVSDLLGIVAMLGKETP